MKRFLVVMGSILLFLTGCNSENISPTLLQTLETAQNTQVQVNYSAPTKPVLASSTPDPARLTISGIHYDEPQALAVVAWEADGVFPNGFKLVFSDQNDYPIYPINPFIQIEASTEREGKVPVEPGKTYHFRVCKFVDSDCVGYSPSVAFQTPIKTPTRLPTLKTSMPAPQEPPAADSAALTITRISSRGEGEALLEWQAEGKFPQGFKILWSKTRANPSFPEDPFLHVSDPGSRSVLVMGEPGVKYFFRVCKNNSKGCSAYSNSYAYTFGGTAQPTFTGNKITITNISDQSTGKALISWNTTGSFENGFEVVWSSSHAYPVYPDDHFYYLSDSQSRSAVISGTPGTFYFFRVCDFNGSGCDTYSQSVPFRFSAEPKPALGTLQIAAPITTALPPASIPVTSIKPTSTASSQADAQLHTIISPQP